MADAYFLISFDITNQPLYDTYIEKVVPLILKHDGTVMVADYKAIEIEGKQKNFNIILKFKNDEDAMGWYNDPEYAEVRKIRWASTEHTYAVLTHEFTGM